VYQDIGLDGLSDNEELDKFLDFVNNLPPNLAPDKLDQIRQDPAADNFKYFLGRAVLLTR